MERIYGTTSQNHEITARQWFHCQLTKVQMGSQRNWLARILTYSNGSQTMEKIGAVLQMQPPINLKQLSGFIGMVNYYRDMWPHRSHILSPLTAKTGAPKKGVKAPPFKWTPTRNATGF
jgi:hypothetical protein